MDKLNPRIETLDFLRGIAIIAVVVVHCLRYIPDSHEIIFIIGLGNYGVQLFFFVSAITMCYIWDKRKNETNHIYNFYLRRIVRIVPLYWFAIIVYLYIYGIDHKSYWSPNGIGFLEISLSLLLIHGFLPSSLNSVVPGGWAISIEMTFYLIFPLLILIFKNKKNFYLIFAFVVWLFYNLILRKALYNYIGQFYNSENDYLVSNYLQLNFFNQLPIFLLGCYIFYSVKEKFDRFEILFFIIWLLVAFFLRYLFNIQGFGYYLIYLIIYLFVKIVMIKNLKFKFFEIIGQNTYMIYLFHLLVIYILIKYTNILWPVSLIQNSYLQLFILSSTVLFFSFIISRISFHLIEKNIKAFLLNVFKK